MTELDRRRFLELTGAAAGAAILGPALWSPRAAATGLQADRWGDPSERTLVVVDLQGGNDALNTFVPESGTYHDLRPTIALDDDELLTWSGLGYGVHPALAALQSFWEADQFAAFYGVGLPEQSRSHFVAQDAWRSATPGEPARSGWLGRWLERTAPAEDIALRAISLGQDTLAAKSETGRAVAVQSVEEYQLRPPDGNTDVIDALVAMGLPAGGSVSPLFAQAQESLPSTVRSVEELQGIIASVTGESTDFGPDPSASLFAAAQAIIQADVGTQVLYITVDGFDTHAGQPQRHAPLLETIAGGVRGLYDALETTGHADRTLVLTVSEFGRRAAENGSAGTDHGNGGLSWLIGPAVAGSVVHGGADIDDLVDGDLVQTLDARSVYDNALRWLGGAEGAIEGDWSQLDVLSI